MAKRISGSSVNWEAISQHFKTDKTPFLAFKAKTDKHLKKVVEKTAELPKIDWSYYRARVASNVVDSFQKSYESIKIPYPSDSGALAKLESKEKELYKMYKSDMQAIDNNIAEIEKELEVLSKQLPFSKMSIEELYLAKPEWAFNPDKPELWPLGMSEEEMKSEKD